MSYVNFLGGLGSNEGLAPMTVEKIKILGAVLEVPAKQHCQFNPFCQISWQMGQIGSAVWLVAPKQDLLH